MGTLLCCGGGGGGSRLSQFHSEESAFFELHLKLDVGAVVCFCRFASKIVDIGVTYISDWFDCYDYVNFDYFLKVIDAYSIKNTKQKVIV